MGDPRNFNAKLIWCTCQTCGYRMTEDERARHETQHIERPGDDYMTPAEVAAAIGRPVVTVRYWIRRGWLAAHKVTHGTNKIWVRKAVLKAFIEENLSKSIGGAVEWAKSA